MAGREDIPKKIRFEVFKRDKFTCQYCGATAPSVLLQIDHIHPVAEGGTNDILNLITACAACNGGKGARLLTDDTIVERQRKQIEELEERRQQLEMMLEWRDELSKFKSEVEDVVKDHIAAATGYTPNERGMLIVRKWLKAFPLDVILNSIDEAFAKYGNYKKSVMTDESWNIAFNKVAAFCRNKIKYGDGPDVDQLLYVQGIVRSRIGDKYFKCLDRLKSLQNAGYSFDQMKEAAKKLDDEQDFEAWMFQWLERADQ